MERYDTVRGAGRTKARSGWLLYAPGLAWAMTGLVSAQTVPPALDPGQLMRQEEIRVPAPARGDAPPFRAPAAPEVRRLEGSDSISVRVIEFRIEGATVFGDVDLQPLLSPFTGRELTYRELRSAADALASYYRERGYFLAQVVLPAQDVTAGTVVLRVIEGRLSPGDGGIVLTGDARLDPARARAFLSSALDDGVLRRQDLERGILLLNDLPGVEAAVTVAPGEVPGTARLATTLRDTGRFQGSASLDNAGNRYTGSTRAGLNVALDDLSGIGDRLSASVVSAIDGRLDYGRLAYSAPVGSQGLRLEAALSGLAYTAGRELANLDSKGDASSFGLHARYPIIRGRLANLYISGGYETRSTSSEVLGQTISDKRTRLLPFSLTGDRIDGAWGGGFTAASLGIAAGELDLSAVPAASTADFAGPRTEGRFTKYLFSGTRIQTINDSTVLQLSISGQAASRNLDSSDKFSVGGPVGVRAYPAGEGLADQAMVVTLETRTVLAKNVQLDGLRIGDIQLAGFYDHGRVRQYRDLWEGSNPVGPNAYTLKSAGIGVNVGIAGRYDARLQVARKIGGNPGATTTGTDIDGSRGRTRVMLLLLGYF
jgi:hemolysin activation/secretion protein